MRIEILARSS